MDAFAAVKPARPPHERLSTARTTSTAPVERMLPISRPLFIRLTSSAVLKGIIASITTSAIMKSIVIIAGNLYSRTLCESFFIKSYHLTV